MASIIDIVPESFRFTKNNKQNNKQITPSLQKYNIINNNIIIHNAINILLFIILSYYFYKYYKNINKKKLEQMDISLFPKDDTNDTIGLKEKLEKLEMELIMEKNNFLKYRDLNVIYDPLAPPEQRPERNQYIYPNVMYNIKTRGEPDEYQLIGLLYNNIINKNYQLYGRRIYPGAFEWEYYIRGRDIGGLDIKFPINNKQEIYDDTILNIPLDNIDFHVKIYKYDTPRYNPFLY